jgi:hypothetical protein
MEINDKIKESKLKISESKYKVMDFDTYINVNGFPIIRRCKNCKFWEPEPEFKNNFGYCMRYPPTITSPAFDIIEVVNTTQFPMTEDGLWCGEYKPMSGALGPNGDADGD